MANIKNYIENIRSAIFGKEVRGSLADGLDAINKETENTTSRQKHIEKTFDQLIINSGNSNAEIVDARVGENGLSFNKLGDRLDSFDSHLAEKTNNLNNRLHFLKTPATGDCVVIQLSDGKNMLIDTQSEANIVYIKQYIDKLNITKFDYVLITHYHGDHAGNIRNLKEYFSNRTIFYLPQNVDASKVSESVLKNEQLVKSTIEEVGGILVQPTENHIVKLDNNVILEFVNTDHTEYYKSAEFDYNNCSMCCYFKVGNNEIFFSGDLAYEGQEFLRTRVRPVAIYKAHHHSSDKFLNNRFMFSIYPKMCICMDSHDVYSNLLTESYLQNWLQSNNIPIYATSRNGDIILEINEADYKLVNKCQSYVKENKIRDFFGDNYIKQYAYQEFKDIVSNYSDTTTLEEIIKDMENGTQIQTIVSQKNSNCPDFISSYGGYIEIYKEGDYARILLTDRNPEDKHLYIGKFYKNDNNITFTSYLSTSKSKFKTDGANYNANVETKGNIIEYYADNSNGLFSLENGKIKINKEGHYQISISIVADIQYQSSEVRANIYQNGNLLTCVNAVGSLNGYTYCSNFIISTFAKNDVIEIRFKPITSGVGQINISSSIHIEEV